MPHDSARDCEGQNHGRHQPDGEPQARFFVPKQPNSKNKLPTQLTPSKGKKSGGVSRPAGRSPAFFFAAARMTPPKRPSPHRGRRHRKKRPKANFFRCKWDAERVIRRRGLTNCNMTLMNKRAEGCKTLMNKRAA